MKSFYFYALSLFLISNLAFTSSNYPIKQVTVLEINSSINPATFNYLKSNFKKLSSANKDLALIKLDTPGGLVSTTKDILTAIGSVDFPVVVWITPEGASATSAGAIMGSGAHLLLMSEGTNIGAATPISTSGDIEKKDSRSKAINDLVALVRSLSLARGRNPDFFEKMISEALSIDARTALKEKVINKIVNKQLDVFEFLNGQSVIIKGEKILLSIPPDLKVKKVEMDPGQQILNIFANPTTAYVLFIIGVALIYFELQTPGGIISGAVGGVFLLMAGIGFQVLPLNLGAMGLIILSFLLFVLEIYITSFGVLTIAGLASLIFGSLFLFRTDNSFIELELTVIYSVVIAITAYASFISYFFIKTVNKEKNLYEMADEKAIIFNILSTQNSPFEYQIKLDGEIWNATSETKFALGDEVKIVDQEEKTLKLKVTKI